MRDVSSSAHSSSILNMCKQQFIVITSSTQTTCKTQYKEEEHVYIRMIKYNKDSNADKIHYIMGWTEHTLYCLSIYLSSTTL